ncbi:M6 family metalloprotease domain-containing protein [bacterium]|nr:M6 family metalloprotease domain-containing protein [bacterium]
MNLKASIYTILILCITQFAFTMPADPDMTRPIMNGWREIFVRQWGDEFAHGYETLDGYTIIRRGKGDEWCYARLDDGGRLLPSSFIVGKDDPSIYEIEKHIRPSRVEAMPRPGQGTALPLQRAGEVKYEGDCHVLALFIDFPDQPHIFPVDDFQQLLFSLDPENPRSMADYFNEVSYGKFHIIGDAVGWYTAKNERAYYGANKDSGSDDFKKVEELVIEAVTAADPYIDFSKYDNDNDGEVDAVNIFHSGKGEESGGSEDDIWAHMRSIGSFKTDDSVKVSSYTIQPELYYDDMTAIGIYCHEFGHVLGLPDLYDSDDSSSGIGYFGLMGYGGNNTAFGKKMDCPAHFCAWSKEYLGWADVSEITSSGEYMLEPAERDALCYKIKGELTHTEYFLVENRQKIGFDLGLPGERGGILIWDIGYSCSTGS